MSVHWESRSANAAFVVLHGAGSSCVQQHCQALSMVSGVCWSVGNTSVLPSLPYLRVAQRKAQEGHGESVDEHERGQVRAGQQREVGAKTIEQQASAQWGEDGSKRHLADGEVAVRHILHRLLRRAAAGGRAVDLRVRGAAGPQPASSAPAPPAVCFRDWIAFQ